MISQRIHRAGAQVLIMACLVFAGLSLQAQQAYFQQEVNVTMRVRLNDTAYTLSAFQEIEYINHSPSELGFIYFHLWPNAYKNHKTALAKQLLKSGKTAFYYSKPDERGFIDSLDFKVNGVKVKWEYDEEHVDICKLILNEPLKAGDSIRITTPFFVKIPEAKFSRLGHDFEAFYMTQWYPKPAVYDAKGWHPMPYLDQGEFYSEFGSYDVSITLPKNYYLAATGDRVDADEEETFINERVKETMRAMDSKILNRIGNTFPASSTEMKTVRFKQHRVHDFAWFADKRLYILHDQIELPTSKRKVDTWVYFTAANLPLWKNAIEYVNEATLFYSHLNGDYPYNHVTAVDGAIMAGGGMEYPNITVIGNVSTRFELDVTITHEVGHNWFYGILGSNEREHPFMDEGINSFYEMRYIRAKYPEKKITEYIGRDSTFKLFRLNKTPMWKEKEIAYLFSLMAHNDQAVDLPAEQYSAYNYGSVVYSKSALVFDYLSEIMGEATFDEAMRFYFEQFKFKHPSPDDLFKTLSYFGAVRLDEFQKHLIQSTDLVDYKIKSAKRQTDGSFIVKLKNKTGSVLPFSLMAFNDKTLLGKVWVTGFPGTKKVSFPPALASHFKIDADEVMPEYNRRNNGLKTKGLFKKSKPLQVNFLTALDHPGKTQLNVVPMIGANYYNGAEVGVAFHNYGFFKKKWEWALAPMFAFDTRTPVGFAELEYSCFPKRLIQQWSIGVKAKSFAYDVFKTKRLNELNNTKFNDAVFEYYKVAPYLHFDFKKKATSQVYQSLSVISNHLFTDSLNSSQAVISKLAERGPVTKSVYSYVNQVVYEWQHKRTIDPYTVRLELQQSAGMMKAFGSLQYKWCVTRRQSIDIRVFAGAFVSGTTANKGVYAFRASGYNGSQDYLFDGNYAARNEGNGFGAAQFMDRDGAMKVWTPLGQSTEWLAAVNIKTPTLGQLPFKFFADAVFCDGRALAKDPFLWDAGVSMVLWKDFVEVYLPLAYNADIKNTLQLNNIDWAHRIRFIFNIHKLAPKRIVQDNLF